MFCVGYRPLLWWCNYLKNVCLVLGTPICWRRLEMNNGINSFITTPWFGIQVIFYNIKLNRITIQLYILKLTILLCLIRELKVKFPFRRYIAICWWREVWGGSTWTWILWRSKEIRFVAANKLVKRQPDGTAGWNG